MRKIIVIIGCLNAFFISSAIGAECPNWYSCFYVGGQVGYANLHYDRAWLTSKTGFTSVGKVDSRNYAGKLLAGYAFNQFFSLETSYLLLQRVTFQKINGTTDDDMKQTIIDVSGKASLPMSYIGLFVKAGGAYVRRSELAAGTARYKANNQYAPVLGGGLSVYITQALTANAEYDQYIQTNDFKRTDYFGAGLAYQLS